MKGEQKVSNLDVLSAAGHFSLTFSITLSKQATRSHANSLCNLDYKLMLALTRLYYRMKSTRSIRRPTGVEVGVREESSSTLIRSMSLAKTRAIYETVQECFSAGTYGGHDSVSVGMVNV